MIKKWNIFFLLVFLVLVSFVSADLGSFFSPRTPPGVPPGLVCMRDGCNMSGPIYMNNHTIFNAVFINATYIGNITANQSSFIHLWVQNMYGMPNISVWSPMYFYSGIYSDDWSNVTINESQIADLNHTIKWVMTLPYLYNDSTDVYFNESKLNLTIDDRDTKWTTDGNYLYNDSVIIYYNDTKLNATILYYVIPKWIPSSLYYYNDSTALYFNESKLNQTIDNLDTDTHVAGDPPYLYNDSTTMYFNESKLNKTINISDSDYCRNGICQGSLNLNNTNITNVTLLDVSTLTNDVIINIIQSLFINGSLRIGDNTSGDIIINESFGIYRAGGFGLFYLARNANTPQIIMGADNGTGAGYFDVENNRDLFINALHTGRVIIGQGGLYPNTAPTSMGNSTIRWEKLWIGDIDVNGSINIDGVIVKFDDNLGMLSVGNSTFFNDTIRVGHGTNGDYIIHNGSGIYRAGGYGLFKIGQNANYPQLYLGNTSSAVAGYIDVDNNAPLYINALDDGEVFIGDSGLYPAVTLTPELGNATYRWKTLYVQDINVSGDVNINTSGLCTNDSDFACVNKFNKFGEHQQINNSYKLYFNNASNYFFYNETNKTLQLWVNGVIQQDWGASTTIYEQATFLKNVFFQNLTGNEVVLDANLRATGNITGDDFFFGDGIYLRNVCHENGSWCPSNFTNFSINFLNVSFIISQNWSNVTIYESQILDLNHTVDTHVAGTEPWLYNDSINMYYNESKLNETLNNFNFNDTDTKWITNQPYLYNDTSIIYFNDSKMNVTILYYVIPKWIPSSPYYYNDSTTLYFNESKLNETADAHNTDYCAGGNCSGGLNVNGNVNISGNVSIGGTVIANGTINATTFYGDFVGNITADNVCQKDGTNCPDLKWNITPPYLYNDTVNLYFNESKMNATIDARQQAAGKWIISQLYLYNDSTTIYLNDTKLNATIDARENDTHVKGDNIYLYNDSTTMYLNETELNNTIDEKYGLMEENVTVTVTGGVGTGQTSICCFPSAEIIQVAVYPTSSNNNYKFNANGTISGEQVDSNRKTHVGDWEVGHRGVVLFNENITYYLTSVSIDETLRVRIRWRP